MVSSNYKAKSELLALTEKNKAHVRTWQIFFSVYTGTRLHLNGGVVFSTAEYRGRYGDIKDNIRLMNYKEAVNLNPRHTLPWEMFRKYTTFFHSHSYF